MEIAAVAALPELGLALAVAAILGRQQIDPKQRIVDLREMLVDRPALKGVPAPIRETNLALMRRGRPNASSGSAGEPVNPRTRTASAIDTAARSPWTCAGCSSIGPCSGAM